MENKQRALREIHDHAVSLLKLRDVVLGLPDGLPGPLFVYPESNYIALHISFDVNDLRTTRRLLGSKWHFVRMTSSDLGQRSFVYRNDDGAQLLVWQIELGTTCQRVQVGEKTFPIYKVVCSPAQ